MLTGRSGWACTYLGVALFAAAPVHAQGVTLEVTRAADGWQLEVGNATAVDARIVSGPPRLADPLVRFDMRQPNGTWTRVSGLTAYDFDGARELVVPAGSRLRLAPRRYAIPSFLDSPGHYRFVVFHRTSTGRVPIATEVQVAGWSSMELDAATAIRARSEAAQCGELTARIDRTITERLETELLAELYDLETSPARRTLLARGLIRRGSFDAQLERTLAHAPWAQAQPLIADIAYATRRHYQRRLRRAAAARAARRLETTAHVDVETYRALEQLADGWTRPVFDALELRLRGAVDHGDEEIALVDLLVFGSVATPTVEIHHALLEALDARCENATGGLAHTCEMARSRLSPRGCVIPAFYRSREVAPLRPAAGPRPSAACRAVARELGQLSRS